MTHLGLGGWGGAFGGGGLKLVFVTSLHLQGRGMDYKKQLCLGSRAGVIVMLVLGYQGLGRAQWTLGVNVPLPWPGPNEVGLQLLLSGRPLECFYWHLV